MNKLHVQLGCNRKDGSLFQSSAVINYLDVMAGQGYAIVLNPATDVAHEVSAEQSEQRINVIEQSLNSILEMAKNNPGLIRGMTHIDQLRAQGITQENDKSLLREQAVMVMTAALSCWEHDLGRSKMELAEASKIWPVYIDKSTPTTRTLDKYLQLESCPKNPRRQRVIDTAEFVLRQNEKKASAYRRKLLDALESFRSLISGA
jgi:two-component system sensor histidine kinase ChiS